MIKRTKLLQVKLTPEEKAAMQRQAQAEGDSHVSSWARRVLVARATTPAVRRLGDFERREAGEAARMLGLFVRTLHDHRTTERYRWLDLAGLATAIAESARLAQL